MDKRLISIIIPAHNEQSYLGACLASIFAQTTNLSKEVIVVNNNSTDKTVDIAKKYDVQIIEQYKPGAAAARNAGAKVALGSLLVFVDADCVLPSDHFKKIESYFSNNPYIDAISGQYVIKDGGKILYLLTNKYNFLWHYFTLMKKLCGVFCLIGGNFAIKKSVFQKLNGFNESIHNVVYSDDFEFSLRFFLHGCRAEFVKNFSIYSSSRRLRRAPWDGIFRTLVTYQLLLKYMIRKASLSLKPLF